MSEKSTEYTFRTQISGALIEKVLTVPFSTEEIANLETVRGVIQPWGEQVLDGPSIYRDLYTRLKIPWADRLRNRRNALQEIQATLLLIEEVSKMSPKPSGYDLVSDDLAGIQSSLFGFLELK